MLAGGLLPVNKMRDYDDFQSRQVGLPYLSPKALQILLFLAKAFVVESKRIFGPRETISTRIWCLIRQHIWRVVPDISVINL